MRNFSPAAAGSVHAEASTAAAAIVVRTFFI
jgi:hypothetical protein